ncbi:hypothetical protein WA158_008015 [Blastocystis sp. Blastoise]
MNTFTIIISLLFCGVCMAACADPNQYELTFIRTYTNHAGEEGASFYRGDSHSTSKRFLVFSPVNDYDVQTGTYCVDNGYLFTIAKTDSYNFWSYGSQVVVKYGANSIYAASLRYEEVMSDIKTTVYNTFNFNIYLTGKEDVRYGDVFQDNYLWLVNDPSLLPNLVDSATVIADTVRYYRINVSIPTDDEYNLYSLSVKSNGGYVVYVNKHIVGNYNLPSETPTSTTEPLSTETVSKEFIFHEDIVDVVGGILYIGVEVHFSSSQIGLLDPFEVILTGFKSQSGLFIDKDFVPECSETVQFEEGSYCSYANDKNSGTAVKYSEKYGSHHSIIMTTSDNEPVWINGYSISNGPSTDSSANKWILFGSNDKETWTQLDYIEEETYVFHKELETRVFSLRSNINKYSSYKFEILDSLKSYGLGIGEVGLMITDNKMISPYFTYNTHSMQFDTRSEIFKPEQSGASGFKIEPSIDSNLIFDPVSGIIQASTAYKNDGSLMIEPRSYTITCETLPLFVYPVFIYDAMDGNIVWCEEEDIWVESVGGSTYYESCPTGQIGEYSRPCGVDGVWGEITNTCHYVCPAETGYSQTEVGETITNSCPVDNQDGAISRTCEANGVWGDITNTCSYFCPYESGWPKTSADVTVTKSCPDGYTSDATRYCGVTGIWGDVVGTDECKKVIICTGNTYLSGDECVVCVNGIIGQDDTGNNVSCTPCQNDEVVVGGVCVSASCPAETVDSITYIKTPITYYRMPKCTSSTTFGYKQRLCANIGDSSNLVPAWGEINDDMCYKKATTYNGHVRQEVDIDLSNVGTIEDPFELCYYGARTLIKQLPFMLSSLLVSTNVEQLSSIETSSAYDLYMGTNNDFYNEDVKVFFDKYKENILDFIKYHSDNKFPNEIAGVENVLPAEISDPDMCAKNSEVDTTLELYEYSPDKCEDGTTTRYNLYQCQQNMFESILTKVASMRCPPRNDPYILFTLTIKNVPTKKLTFNTYIAIYRAIMRVGNMSLKNMFITRFDVSSTSSADSIVKIVIQPTDTASIATIAANLMNLSEYQRNKFLSIIKLQINVAVTEFDILTEVLNNGSRRLRGL